VAVPAVNSTVNRKVLPFGLEPRGIANTQISPLEDNVKLHSVALTRVTDATENPVLLLFSLDIPALRVRRL
jgi:hypothetical protein